MRILAAAAFVVRSMYHSKNVKIPSQIVFVQDIILLIKHVEDWRYIHQSKQAQIYKYSIRESNTIIDNDCRMGDKFETRTKSVYKYYTWLKGLYEIVQT